MVGDTRRLKCSIWSTSTSNRIDKLMAKVSGLAKKTALGRAVELSNCR